MSLLPVTALLWIFPISQAYKLVDLTHPLSANTYYWPGVPKFNRSLVLSEFNNHNVWVEFGVFTSGEHGGTHIDVPRHFVKNGYDLKDLPLERTVAEGVMLDFSAEAAADPDYAVPVEKLLQWEAEHGRIPDQAAVLFNFGYSHKFTTPEVFLNTNDSSDPSTFHYPFISLAAAQWLVDNRDLKIIGTDLPSPDAASNLRYDVHLVVLPRNIIIMENVNIPKSLPPRDFRLHSSPIRIENGTGVQTRIYAMVYERMNDGASRFTIHCSSWVVAFGFSFISFMKNYV